MHETAVHEAAMHEAAMKDPEKTSWLQDPVDPGHRRLRQALDEAPPHHPSELRHKRVWARVAAPGSAQRTGVALQRRLRVRRAVAVAATAGVAFAFVGLWSSRALRRESVRASAVENQPTGSVDVTAPVVRELTPASPPATADRANALQTDEGEHLVHQLRQGAEAELQPRSLMVLDNTGVPEVRRGRVHFRVSPQPAGATFKVRVRDFLVVVVGTQFVVNLDGTKAGVAVEEGIVEIWRNERLARLRRGQSWSDAGVPANRAAVGRATALVTPGGVPAGGLAEARAARRANDPKRALAICERLASGGGTAAENAQYEIGAIYRDELGRPRDALRAWQRYRTRYPDGLLRAEADLSVVETLAHLNETSRALREALAFLDRYPHSERRGEVARVAGDLYRSRGDCQRAIALYGSVDTRSATARDADDAAFGRATCLASLGARDAPAALRGYLRLYPSGKHREAVARSLAAAAVSVPKQAGEDE